MVWISQIVFWIPLILAIVILLILFRRQILSGELSLKLVKNATIIIVSVYIVQLLARAFLFFLSLRQSELGVYLLPNKGSSFFVQNVWYNLLQPLVISVITGAVFALIIILVRRYSKRPLFEETDWLLVFLAIFVVGYPQFMIMIVAFPVIMIFFQLFQGITRGKKYLYERLKLAPALLFTSLVILILANFHFYQNFLIRIGFTKLVI